MKTNFKTGLQSSRKAFTLTQPLKFFVLVISSTVIFYSCGGDRYERTAKEEVAASETADSVFLLSSSAARITKADSNHTFIRTADIRFSVKDVREATFRIEDVIAKHNGYVSYTNLSSSVSYERETRVSEDSLMKARHFSVENSITIRVPNTNLDAALRDIAPLMEFLDYRQIKADDVKFTLLANQLAEKRLKRHNNRLTDAIDEKGKKMRETTEAENSLLAKQELADNRNLENLELMDKVEYSTVTLFIYQPETIQYTLVPFEKTITPFKPSFGEQLGTSFKTGWTIFEQIILFFVRIWGILVLIGGLIILIRLLVLYLSRSSVKA